MSHFDSARYGGDLGIGLPLPKVHSVSRESNGTPSILPSNLVNGDSDADSGIVAVGPGRIGSTSSTDTDPDVTLACKYVPSLSQSQRSARDSMRTPIPSHGTNGKPVFQRVRFDDQLQQSEQTIRKSCRKFFANIYPNNSPGLSPNATSAIVSPVYPSTNSRRSSDHLEQYFAKETHPLAHHRLSMISPFTLTSQSSLSSASQQQRSWSTLPRNNKTSSKYQQKESSENCNNHGVNSFDEVDCKVKSTTNEKVKLRPDLIESHSITVTKASLKSSLSSPSSSSVPTSSISSTTNQTTLSSSKPKVLATLPSLSATPVTSTSLIYKSRSCSTLNSSSTTDRYKSPMLSTPKEEDEPKVTKLCTIDPLESTDSMVCAFASVANVISDDASSIVGGRDKHRKDKNVSDAVAAAVAAVRSVTSSTANSMSALHSPIDRSTVTSHHYHDNSIMVNERSNEHNNDKNDNNGNNDDNDDDADNNQTDHQYEAIFPCGKGLTSSNSNKPSIGSSSMISSRLTSSSTSPLMLENHENSVQLSSTGLSTGNSVETKEIGNQLSVNSNERESSNDQPSGTSEVNTSSTINTLPSSQPATSTASAINIGGVTQSIRYKSILKDSAKWPVNSVSPANTSASNISRKDHSGLASTGHSTGHINAGNMVRSATPTHLSTNIVRSKSSLIRSDKLEAAYLQPDQIYPSSLVTSSSSTPSSLSQTTTTTTTTTTAAVASSSSTNEPKSCSVPRQITQCEVEYAVITKSPNKMTSTKKLGNSESCPKSLSYSLLDQSQITRNMKIGPLTSSQSTNGLMVLDQTTNPSFIGEKIRPDQSTSSKWFNKRLVGLRKAISRAFSSDRLPKSDDVLADVIPSNVRSSSSAKSSQSTPNLNCQSHDSLKRNQSTEDLTNDLRSFVKSVKNRMSLRKSSKAKVKPETEVRNGQVNNNNEKRIKWLDETIIRENLINDTPPDLPVFGELIELKSDGSQVIELVRSNGKPFGFFLARGTVNNVRGVFVSRMRDETTQSVLTGLLEIGDEIVAIDGLDVKQSNIAQVNQLMTSKRRIVLTVRPYTNQQQQHHHQHNQYK